MSGTDLAKLALAGLLSAGVVGTIGCGMLSDKVEVPDQAAAPQPPAEAPAADAATADAPAADAAATYSDVHDCSGKNSCKGLGGCKVDEAKLKELAEKKGIAVADAGAVHDCSGKNSCKGLGGCAVDQAKFDELKAKLGEEAVEEAPAKPKNHPKGGSPASKKKKSKAAKKQGKGK